ncbi:MAG: hypothetical protein O4805_15745 [Trichodesmium sp. St16_bin2-tuft]|jgi:hypothetical protein|nr:hypothetical protein [Trichodesmium sp. St18_bin1]MDE5088503.1 hypothetical protein [Trichodesmium sp. St16_bin2-tuft]MDE5105702.1 hypothetical protein [Trichodesmium sp. St17_bin3_1_1]MDE5120684.1 hypothetical protein [Trichodesmium sp. St19_bin1]
MNLWEIAKRSLLKSPPQSFAEMARELDIPYQGLIAHNRRKCKPLLKQIYQELLGGKK